MKKLGENGFTLIEMMIAITLLAGMVVVLSQGFNLSIRVWEAADRRIEGHYSVTEALSMFSRQIKTSRKVYAFDPKDNSRRIAFMGTTTELSYVTSSPRLASGRTVSGLYLQRIVFKPDKKAVYFYETPFDRYSPLDLDIVNPIEIGAGKIDSFSFEYLVQDTPLAGDIEEEMVYSWVTEINLTAEGSFGEENPNIFPEKVRVKIKTSGDENFIWPSQEIQIFHEHGVDVAVSR